MPGGTDDLVAGLASAAQIAALVLARVGRGRVGAPAIDALALGVLVALLIPAVARLISASDVLLARSVAIVDPAARGTISSAGPIVVQNLAAALVIVSYVIVLRAQRRADRPRSAPLFALGLSSYALAEGMSSGGSLSSVSWLAALGLAVMHVCRGLALAGAPAQYSRALGWLLAAALFAGPLEYIGASIARALGFDAATSIAVPLLVAVVTLLVVLIGQLTGNRMRQLPPGGFLAGLALTLVSARLIGSSFP